MQDKLQFIRDLINSCFLQTLQQDSDSVPLQSKHFDEYRKVLEQQLPVLYDFVAQNEQWIFSSSADLNANEVHASLIVLMCELTAASAIYRLEHERLLKNANAILRQHQQLEPAIATIIFKYYQEKLHKNCWKRQLGSVHGFLRFLEFRYSECTTKDVKDDMCGQWLDFCLSVGLIVRESHEPTYKHMGIRIFQVILNHAKFADIQDRNIHSVIYDSVFKDVHFMDSVVVTADIWSCLYKCLDFFADIDSFNWNCVDDMLEILLRNISLAPNSLISICLLKFVTKLGAYFAINRMEIEAKCNADLSTPTTLEDCRRTCAQNTSYTIFRWAKRILNMFIVDSYKLMQSVNICRQLLQEFHRCYMVCIMPITLPVIEPHLLTFYDKFTSVLMEVINLQQRDSSVVQLVKCILETFHLQLLHSPHCDNSAKLQQFRIAFAQLLQHELFIQNK